MKNFRIFAAAFALTAALAIPCGAAHAQAEAAAAAAAAPVVVRAIRAITPRSKVSGDWMKAEVIHFDANSVIVREADNERMIHTFTYAPTIKDKMQQLEGKGGYQFGDPIRILHEPGQTVALRIHGKPSKTQ